MKPVFPNLFKYSSFLVFIFPLVFLIQVAVFQPYFGNMDDSVLLDLADKNNPFEYAYEYGWLPEAGVITNAAILVTWPAYALGATFGPQIFFSVNAIAVFSIILFTAYALTRAFNWRSPVSVLVFVSVALLWPYTSDLFFFPSLQEKGIILGVGLLFYWISLVRQYRSASFYWVSYFLVSLFAFATKPHIVLFIPAAVASLWISNSSQGQKNFVSRTLGASIGWLILGAIILWLALVGSYTSGTRGAPDFEFVDDRRFQLMFLITAFYTGYLLSRLAKGRLLIMESVPLLMVLPFLVSFTLWDIRNYYLSVAAVGVASMVVSMINNWQSDLLKLITALTLFSLSLFWIFLRVPQVYQPLSSIAEFLESPIAKQYSQRGITIGVSCVEAPTHFNRYARWLSTSGLTFKSSIGPSQTAFFLADSRLCPPSSNVSQWPVIWSSSREGGYVLYEHPS